MSKAIYNPMNIKAITKNRHIDIDLHEVWVNGEKIKFRRAVVEKCWIETTYEAYDHLSEQWKNFTVTGVVTYRIKIELLSGYSLAMYIKDIEGSKDIRQLAFLGKSVGYAKDFIGNMIVVDYETKSEGHRPIEVKATFVADLTEVDKLV